MRIQKSLYLRWTDRAKYSCAVDVNNRNPRILSTKLGKLVLCLFSVASLGVGAAKAQQDTITPQQTQQAEQQAQQEQQQLQQNLQTEKQQAQQYQSQQSQASGNQAITGVLGALGSAGIAGLGSLTGLTSLAGVASDASSSAPAGTNLASPATNSQAYGSQSAQGDWQTANQSLIQVPALQQPGDTDVYSNGMLGGVSTPIPYGMLNLDDFTDPRQVFSELSATQLYAGAMRPYLDVSVFNGPATGSCFSMLNSAPAIKNIQCGNLANNIMVAGGMNGNYGVSVVSPGIPTAGTKNTVANATENAAFNAASGAQQAGDPNAATNQAQANQAGLQATSASNAGEDANECMQDAFDGMTQYLVNVANEDAGSPCQADQVSKTYENAAWMVMQMYKACFIPMAILFLLPGAIITNATTMVKFGFLSNPNDEDLQTSPFVGIIRSITAIFLIPATQMIVSYMIDIGNSLEYSCQPYINIPLIIMWAEEQVQTFSPDQQGNPIKNMPNVPMAPWRGKTAGMPVQGAVLEQVSGLDGALSDLANQCMHYLSEGLTICYAFQIVMVCYLLCIGPLAAAFFAWPSLGQDLFRKAFASWVDAVVILCLWKFWWNVVLICMTVRLQSNAVNPYDPFEVYYLAAFLCILMFVPFNPFDFKPGTIVGNALEKAQAVAQTVASSGGPGGGGGVAQGGSAGGQSPMGNSGT